MSAVLMYRLLIQPLTSTTYCEYHTFYFAGQQKLQTTLGLDEV